jgi:hypothetical protein
MGSFEFGAGVAAMGGQEQRGVNDTQIGFAHLCGKPISGHQKVHAALPTRHQIGRYGA